MVGCTQMDVVIDIPLIVSVLCPPLQSDMRISDKRHLFIEGEVSQAAFRMVLLEDVDRECYYGPCLGFQVSPNPTLLPSFIVGDCT